MDHGFYFSVISLSYAGILTMLGRIVLNTMLLFLGSVTDPSTNIVKEKTGHKSIWFVHNVFDYFGTKQYNFLYLFYPPQVLTVEILNIHFLIHIRNEHHKE